MEKKMIKMWIDGSHVKNIADVMGLSTQSIYTKINVLRKRGVKIPDREAVVGARKQATVEELNNYIETLIAKK